ncbi:2-dehydropantoate 2-reductase [Azoarcus olearius]|uniref:ketopantoate reductase family protein n=1 Tax=Azoarcus sp. (strain BH72) TaxID=418699 RepID=UPI000806181A|nr:2-dehydropantoate 2-reductase [Azoarcus olearius]ANQ83283.1 2-dehydropantoate 2-reductase [Azoarcus olearius]
MDSSRQREAFSTDVLRAAPYPVAIIGAGALGLSLASRLIRSGPVALVASNADAAQRLRAGVRVGAVVERFDGFAAPRLPQADWVVVVVKAGDTRDALRSALAMRPRGVLSLQNGLLDLEPAGTGTCVAQGVTTMGAFRTDEGVMPVSDGETLMPQGFEPLAALFQQAGLPARIEVAMQAARLAKLLVNVVLNPLTAVFRVRTGELLAAPYMNHVEALVAEAWPVLRAAGLMLEFDEARAKVWSVVRSTADNRTSMLQDVLAGRRTEREAITGAFLRLADGNGAAVPTHRALHTLLGQIDADRC